jgi:hypothetical protein
MGIERLREMGHSLAFRACLTAPLLVLLPLALMVGALRSTATAADGGPTITGTVRNAQGPLAGAHVRVQATETKTTTDKDGNFALAWPADQGPVRVIAWANGYYMGWVTVPPGGGPVSITLEPYFTTDNVDYQWFSHEGARGSVACSHCHTMLLYKDWQRDAHSRSAINPRFLSMYNGTDLDGHQSPPTRFIYDRDGKPIPQPPDPTRAYFGPGFKLDFPTSAGPCAACHVPLVAARRAGLEGADPNQATGVEKDGVACELCHKIGAVRFDPATRMPYADKPGVLSVRLYRPPQGHQLFFGQLDDVAGEDSYLPLVEESAFCAPCHFGVFSGVPVYNSYGEWLASPYSNPQTGKTCQGCHMPPAGYDTFVYPEKGGLRRDPARILSHTMPGAASEELLRNALTMVVEGQLQGSRLTVDVHVTNDKTGHHVPTDSPLRHLILLVIARDAEGRPLPQVDGPEIPSWGGVGSPDKGYYAGLPGKAFAKVLQELGTEIAPTGAYWNRTRVLSDNRIAAYATDTSSYAFAAPPGVAATVEVRLLFRRAYRQLADLKKWPDSDIVMAEKRIILESPRPEAQADN